MAHRRLAGAEEGAERLIFLAAVEVAAVHLIDLVVAEGASALRAHLTLKDQVVEGEAGP